MKKSKYILFVFIILGACRSVFPAMAQEDASSRFINNLDKNGDGQLSADELPEQFRGGFSRLDSNGDGLLSVDEHRARRKQAEKLRIQAEERTDQVFRTHDKDVDDSLSTKELPVSAQRSFQMIDRDKDGKVSRREYTQYMARTIGKQAALKTATEKMQPATPPTFRDYAYGEHEKQRFDLWVAGADGTNTPLVIYIHGGGFKGGDKAAVNGPLIGKLLEKGIAFASMNYRLTDVGPYPMQMHDCARGLQTIRQQAEKFHIDPKRIALMGGSAGSGISQWLAFHEDLADPKSDDPISRQSTRVSCAVPYAAQCSYDPRFIAELFDSDALHEALFAFYGMKSEEDINNPKFFPLFEDASPVTHLTADDPPIFLYYGQPDKPLPKNSSGKEHIHHPKFGHYLKEKMDSMGIECTLRLREDTPAFPNDEVIEFFIRHLKD